MTQLALETTERANIVNELSAAAVINLQPYVRTENIRTKKAYIGTPGRKLFGSVTAGSMVRGCISDPSRTTGYIVVDTGLYSVNTSGVRTSLGTIAGTGLVIMLWGLTQLAILTTDGSSASYYYTPGTSTLATITDPDYLKALSATTQDGYLIYVPNRSDGTFWLSDVGDFSSYNALQFAAEEGQADILMACVSANRDLWLLGQSTSGVWYDSGNFVPFDRRTWIQKGCAARRSAVQVVGNCMWLAALDSGKYGFVAGGPNTGYSIEPICNEDVTQQINSYSTVSDCFGFTYTENDHVMVQWTFPTANKTWLYDSTVKEFMNKQDANTGNMHPASCCMLLGGKNIIGDYASGRLWEMSLSYLDDDGSAIYRELTTPTQYQDNKWIRVSRLQCDIAAGVGNSATPAPVLDVKVSKDGGNNFVDWGNMQMGAAGATTTRAYLTRFGKGKFFTWKINTLSRARVYISSLSAEYKVGGL